MDYDTSYEDLRRIIFAMLRTVDATQHDAHVWAHVDCLADNANNLRRMVWNRKGGPGWPLD